MTNDIKPNVDVLREVLKVEDCDRRLGCLTNNYKCSCVERPINYTFKARMSIHEVAEYYINDVCVTCKNYTVCSSKMKFYDADNELLHEKKKHFLMYFKGTSNRNGQWENHQTYGRKNIFPLFKWKVWCKKYLPVKEA